MHPLSVQDGPDAMVEQVVRGIAVRCYADRPSSIVQVLQDALDTSAQDVLLLDPARGGQATSYAEFARLVEGAAAGLLARGLEPGNRVAVLLRNGLEAAVAIWACARAGLVHIGLPAGAPPARLAELVALTTPSLLLAQTDLLPDVVGLLSDLELSDLELPDLELDDVEVLVSSELPWQHSRLLPDEDATYMLIPTSGTTGRPKAVRVTGRMTGHAAAFYARTLGLTAADRTAVHLPFGWVSGHVTQLTPAMLSGGSVVTMATFSGPALVQVCREHAVTWLDVVPSIWELLLRVEGFRADALPGLRLAVYGGAPAPAGTLDRVADRMPRLRLYDVYALSETCAPVSCLLDGERPRRPGSVGRPVAYAEVRVVSPDGVVVARGEPGELQVRSPAVTPGYWGEEPSPLSNDGWLWTGDVGRMDGEGYLTVSGRAVDLLIRGGVNIYPAEVERALLATGLLADAAVVGLPSSVAGQSVAAAVVLRAGTELDVPLLRRAVQRELGTHAVPRRVRAVQVLPRNRHGKLDRVAVVELLSSRP